MYDVEESSRVAAVAARRERVCRRRLNVRCVACDEDDVEAKDDDNEPVIVEKSVCVGEGKACAGRGEKSRCAAPWFDVL